VGGANKASGLGAINYLSERVMEECILDVELVHGPTLGDSQSQHSPSSGSLEDEAEGLIVVHTMALGETTENPMRLLPL
jgi:hypothetical protein